MHKTNIFLVLAILLILNSMIAVAQEDTPVIIEAESGILDEDFSTGTDEDVTYVTINSNLTNYYPGTGRTISYSVTFPDTGTYALYVRLYVGANSYDDDSFFYGNGFGEKDATNADDWITVNQLSNTGYTKVTDYVTGTGSASYQSWVWVNLSKFSPASDTITFAVDENNLTRVFQIGAREDGLRIDKFVFGLANQQFTVENLNNGEAGCSPGEIEENLPLADGLEKFLGCCFSSSIESGFEEYWNQVTPENASKWGIVESTRDVMSWTSLDEAYNFAKENGFPFKFHTLIWGSQQPDWIEELDTAAQLDEIEEWYAAVAERYDTIDMIDVVNEPLHAPPDSDNSGQYIDALGGTGETGYDWVIKSFRMARKYFPDSKLLINEYGIVNSLSNAVKYLKLIKLLQEEDLIDGIGLQSHSFSLNDNKISTILSVLDTLDSAGLDIYISELDIDGLKDATHLKQYMKIFPELWEYAAVKGITLWGYTPDMWRTDYRAYLVLDDGTERPSMEWLRAYLNNTYVAMDSISISTANGSTIIDTKGDSLELEVTIYPDTATLEYVTWSVDNESIASISADGVLTALSDGTVRVTATSAEYGSSASGYIDIKVTNQSGGSTEITACSVQNLTVFPNPSNGNFTLKGIDNIKEVCIHDLTGRIINLFNTDSQSSINVNLDVGSGIYLIKCSDGKNNYFKKIAVR